MFKMEMIVVLSYLSHHKGDLVGDLFLQLLTIVVSYFMSARMVQPHLPEDKLPIFMKWKKIMTILLLLQLGAMTLLVFMSACFPSPRYGHSYLAWGVMMVLQAGLMIVANILRIINLALLTALFINYIRIIMPHHIPRLVLATYMVSFLLTAFVQLYVMCSFFFPTMNPYLTIYETFYRIRTLFLNPSIPRKQKISSTKTIFQEMVCSVRADPDVQAVFNDQLKHTFKKHPDVISTACQKQQQRSNNDI